MPVPFYITTRAVEGSPQTGGNVATGNTYVNLLFLSPPGAPAMRWTITGVSASVTGATQSELIITTLAGDPDAGIRLYDMYSTRNIVQPFNPPLGSDFGFSGLVFSNIVIDDPPPGNHATTLNVQGIVEGTETRQVIASNISFDDRKAPDPPPGGWEPDDWPGGLKIG
jgi:hypothetical protein